MLIIRQQPIESSKPINSLRPRKSPNLAAAGTDLGRLGIALCGVDNLMTQKLGIPTYLVDDPENAVAIGSLRVLELYPVLQRNLPQF